MTKEDTIKACKDLAMKNYEKGMDAIVECWDASDWESFYVDNKGSYPKMERSMMDSAELWIERNLNARWGEDDDECLSMVTETTLTDEDKAHEEDMEAEWGCSHRSPYDGGGSGMSYEESCYLHSIGAINMDTGYNC